MQVYDLLPSVDLVTGVSPQRHVWSVALLLDLNPRLVLAFLHWHYLSRRYVLVAPPERSLFTLVTHAGLALHVAETLSLSLVSGLRNCQEYPAHERIYTHFLVSSLMFMLSACLSLCMCQHAQRPKATDDGQMRRGTRTRAGLVLTLCRTCPQLFSFGFVLPDSWFPVCQWVYALCHVAFHLTLVYEIPNREVIVGTTRRRALRRDSRHG
ncbi:hypothetical protein HPB50_027129 [Hyalomma asiaticum]|uniref:Uncharacterized protein n=1 Tax=Hyalomma asiaticum TaxID=266040 RepID=A0ACB7RNQ4_HYAAI|nr:hypothetical protein HPB50_027129 [Hyalomma asiaticum]